MISTQTPHDGHKIGMTALPYIRFSTPKQERGASRERQHELTMGMIATRGWTPGPPIEDLGRSAWKGEHIRTGALGRFSEKVRCGDIPPGTILVVEKIDRLSRQGFDVLNDWMREMIGHGLLIATVEDGKVYDADNLRDLGSYINRLLKAEGAFEYVSTMRARVIDRIRRNQTERAITKLPTSAIHPRWLTYNASGELEPIASRVRTIRVIYELSAEGMGVASIAKTLNADLSHPCWTSARWLPTTIRHLLNHPSVDGTYQPMEFGKPFGDPIAFYPPILDNELIARARAARKGRSRSGGPTSDFVNPFQGLTRCEGCRGRMHVQKSKDSKTGVIRRFFRCYNAAHGAGCDRKTMFRFREAEAGVLDQLLHLALDDRFFARPDTTKVLAVAVADLEKRLELERSQSDRLLTLILSTDIPDELMLDRRAKLTTAISETGTALERARAELATARGSIDPAAHMARVFEVRTSVEDPNPAIALRARRMIATALKGVITEIGFDATDKTITVIVAGGLAAMRFDNRGQMIARFDLSGDPAMEAGTVGRSPVWTANVEAMKRRAA